MISHYEMERLLRRVESGTTTVADAELLRRLLCGKNPTAAVATEEPKR
jgi:hypothetical protein